MIASPPAPPRPPIRKPHRAMQRLQEHRERKRPRPMVHHADPNGSPVRTAFLYLWEGGLLCVLNVRVVLPPSFTLSRHHRGLHPRRGLRAATGPRRGGSERVGHHLIIPSPSHPLCRSRLDRRGNSCYTERVRLSLSKGEFPSSAATFLTGSLS